jgi:hypothetical protein
MIASDHALFLQSAHAAQTGRRGQPHTVGEFNIRHAPFALQFGKQFAIDRIKICHVVPAPKQYGTYRTMCQKLECNLR